jgi:hypothetical protein
MGNTTENKKKEAARQETPADESVVRHTVTQAEGDLGTIEEALSHQQESQTGTETGKKKKAA